MHPTRIFRTIGFRLAALYAGLFGLSVLILSGMIYRMTNDALRQQLAANIEGEIAALVKDHENGSISHVAFAIEQRLKSGAHSANFYLLLDRERQKIVGNLPHLSSRDGWQELPAPRESGEDDPADSGEHLLLAFGVALSDGSLLLVGEDTFRIVEVEEAIVRAFGWAFGVMLVLGTMGGSVLSLGFLRRIDAINRTSRAIIDGRLADRVPIRGTGDELDRLATNLNEMLDRMQALMESLRQVSSDIAHELRTPLSRLRQRLESARRKSRNIEDYETVVDDAISDTDVILKTFSALLRIAQIEAGTRKAAFSTVDLSKVFRSIMETYGAVAEDRQQTLTAKITPDIRVRGDRELLIQMLANIVENAIRHTPEGTHIALILERRPEGPVGIVADNGPGIPVEARDKVFRRFFRMERSRSTAGSGLGLSLVAAVAEIHGIAITIADNEPGLKVLLDFASRKSA